jgi:transcription elongation factor GreA
MSSRRPPEPVSRGTALSLPTTSDLNASLTTEGRRLLEERISVLRVAAADLADALQDPQRREDVVEAYQRTAQDIAEMQALLDKAATLDDVPDDPGRVDLGDRVSIRLDDGTEEAYVVVHRLEALVDDARISVESPLGQALLGREVGETVEVSVPAGTYRCTILTANRNPQGAGR